MGAGIWLWGVQRAIPAAFGLSFAVAILVFSIALQLLEWRGARGADPQAVGGTLPDEGFYFVG